ncbi:hypothetical protein ACUN90_29295, partial [Escherichia sp. SP-MK2]
FALQVNGGGGAVLFLNGFSNNTNVANTSSQLITMSNILNLAVGDIVSIGLMASTPSPVSLANAA